MIFVRGFRSDEVLTLHSSKPLADGSRAIDPVPSMNVRDTDAVRVASELLWRSIPGLKVEDLNAALLALGAQQEELLPF